MSPETAKLIREATAALKLRDIVLFESHLFRAGAPPDVGDLLALQQHKRGVRYAIGNIAGDGTEERELHVLVSLGERVVENAQSEEPKVYFGIEADYLVIYDLVAEVSEEALKAFSDFNSVHNVWPFWRQHVFDLVALARLPQLAIPLFSGNSP
jgi:hypothetical protein